MSQTRNRSRSDECRLCCGEIVTDRREGHRVCTDCGTVAEERICCDELDFNRHSAMHAEEVVCLDKELTRAAIAAKDRIRSFVGHAHMSSAISDTACSMADLVPDRALRNPVDAWAVIALAAESLTSPLALQKLALDTGLQTVKIIGAIDKLRPYVAHMLPTQSSGGGITETLVEMNRAFSELYGPDEATKKLQIRRHVLRMLDGGVSKDSAFMNVRARTRARALIAEHLRQNGGLDSTAVHVLQSSRGGVSKAMRRLKDMRSAGVSV